MASSLQKATAAANSYHGSAIRCCNKAKLIVETLVAHECDEAVAKVRKAHQKVQAAVVAEEAFTAVLMVTKDEEVETFKERAEIISNTTAETAAMCLRSIGVAEAEVHLMSREDLIMFRCHTCVVEEGILVERRRLDTPLLPEMKQAMTRYKGGKAQKKGLKKDRELGPETRIPAVVEVAAKRSILLPFSLPQSGASCASAVG